MSDRKSGYPLVEKFCQPCGLKKQMPSRNKWCSPQCAVIGRSQQIAELADPAATVEEMLEPANGFAQDELVVKTRQHPKGWEPSVEISGDEGVLITGVVDFDNPTSEALLESGDLDPEKWTAIPTQMKKWMVGDEWKFSYRCKITPKSELDNFDEYLDEMRNYERPVIEKMPAGDLGFGVFIADPQIGKPDEGGVKGTMDRWFNFNTLTVDRINELRQSGKKIETLYLCGMGDIIESCDGFYPMQAYGVELNRRQQTKLARRLLLDSIVTWAPYFERVVVAAVPGNHGENRKDGNAFTDFSDNDDVAVFEQLEEILAMNKAAFGHVSFKIPDDALSMTLDMYGTCYGLTHGHAAGKGASGGMPQAKIINWLKGQAWGEQPIGDARVVVSAHYHHYSSISQGVKTHFQCPAMEGGSTWFTNQTGQKSYPGLLTMVTGEKAHRTGRGWSDVEVL